MIGFLKRWCNDHLFTFLKYETPNDDEEYTLVHQAMNLCPNCYKSGHILKTPAATYTVYKMFSIENFRQYYFQCLMCKWKSKTYKEKIAV